MTPQRGPSNSIGDRKASLSLIATLKNLEVVGTFKVNGSRARYKRSVTISVDEENRWESKRHPPDPRLLQGEEPQFSFRPSSALKIEVRAHKPCVSGIFSRRKFHVVGVATEKLVDLIDKNDAILGLTDETGVKVTSVKVNIVSTLPADLLKKVDDAVASMGGTTVAAVPGQVVSVVSTAQAGYSDAQTIGDCIPALAQALQTAANIVRTISEAHPILKVACNILLSAYEAMKAQQVQDDAVRGLAESLREMVGVANKIPDLLVVDGTDNVIEAISRVLLQVASVIDEYARLPFIGRTLRNAVSKDLKTLVQQSQDRCKDLLSKYDRRLAMQANITVSEGFQRFADDKLLKKIKKWLDAPDPSKNYDNALEKHQENTCS